MQRTSSTRAFVHCFTEPLPQQAASYACISPCLVYAYVGLQQQDHHNHGIATLLAHGACIKQQGLLTKKPTTGTTEIPAGLLTP